MENKTTEYQATIRERDNKILAKYDAMMAEGYMKTQALRIIAEEFGFYSTAGVYRIIKKYKKN